LVDLFETIAFLLLNSVPFGCGIVDGNDPKTVKQYPTTTHFAVLQILARTIWRDVIHLRREDFI